MIIRRRHTANFTTIGNALFEDERLAADEVGILAYLLSRPHDWEVRRPAMMRRWHIGRDGLKRIIDHWMLTGWCRAEKTRLPDGTFDIVYEIRDEPGPTLTEEEVTRALSLVSGEAARENSEGNQSQPCSDASLEAEPCASPPTSQPPLAEPPPADLYVVDKRLLNTDSPRTESTQIEREDARGHDRKARFIAAFETRWPTAATDDRSRTAKAARELPDDREQAALNGIGPFLEKLKRDGRKHVPGGWKYLEEKRWTLLEAGKSPGATSTQKFAADSAEAKAIEVAYVIAGKIEFLNSVMRSREDHGIYYRGEVSSRLLALATAPPSNDWSILNRQQAAAWNEMLAVCLTVQSWN